MKDNFLMGFCENEANYHETIKAIKKALPGRGKRRKTEIASNRVNQCIRNVIFNLGPKQMKNTSVSFSTGKCMATRLNPDEELVLLSVVLD